MKREGIVVFLGMVLLGSLAAQETCGAGVDSLSEIHCGSMVFLPDGGGKPVKAPELAMKARISVSGMIASVSFLQEFSNPYGSWLEGTYAFPLPETAAVSRFRMTVAGRAIEGEIKERHDAEAVYEEAKADGKKAALLEQERPNLFTVSVANLPPGEKISVELEYSEALEPEDGGYSLRFPLVVTPRYDPGAAHSAHLTDNVAESAPADGGIPTEFDLKPFLGGGTGRRNPVDLSVRLDAGFPLAAVASLYHGASVRMDGAASCDVYLSDGPAPADRDFVLAWRPEAEPQPEASLFLERGADAAYALLMVQPLSPEAEGVRPIPQETVYLIDRSGSMGGASIRQAREALLAAVRLMREDDLCNIVAFSDDYRLLFEQSRPMTEENRRKAVRFVEGLAAEGGTEMKPALDRVLSMPRDRSRLGRVVFITDGAVSNEEELFSLIRRKLDDRRLFTVGIGSAPNTYFMRKAAAAGRGTFTYVGSQDGVAEAMDRLFARIRAPMMRNLTVRLEGASGEIWPQPLPDLYAGQPVVLLARLSSAEGRLVVQGEMQGRSWLQEVALSGAESGDGVGVLWARKKIETLLDGAVDGVGEEEIRGAVLQVALRFRLLSPYTSFVAVEHAVSRPGSEGLDSGKVPLNNPAGWEPTPCMLGMPKTATPGALWIVMGALLAALSLSLLAALRRRTPWTR